MNATLIGISSSLITILLFTFLKRFDKNIVYGLILAAIGFLYVGYDWTDINMVIINLVQAIFFLMIAYLGIKKNVYFLVAGYILHGLWDFVYEWIGDSGAIPPHYDFFCATYDFIVGFYLLYLKMKEDKASE